MAKSVNQIANEMDFDTDRDELLGRVRFNDSKKRLKNSNYNLPIVQNLTTRAINGSDDVCYAYIRSRKWIKVTRVSTTKAGIKQVSKLYPVNSKNEAVIRKTVGRLVTCNY